MGAKLKRNLVIIKAGGKHYAADIHSKARVIKRAGSNVTSVDLIQAMMESFRISGTIDSDKSDSEDDDVIMAAREFKFGCNLCGKNRHNAKGLSPA